jgi:hypothetical protein
MNMTDVSVERSFVAETRRNSEIASTSESGSYGGQMGDVEKQATKPQRRRSARKQLEDIVKQFDDCLSSQELKDGKRADVVIEKAGVLKTLLQVDIDEKHDEALVENQRLQEQHTADAATIDTLKSRVAELESRATEVKTVMVSDPETVRVKELNAALENLLRVLAGRITTDDGKAQMAVRILESCPESAARFFLPMLGLNYSEYARMMLNYSTERELLRIVENAVNGDGPLSRFARARLAVNHQAAIAAKPKPQSYIPDTRSAEEKLAEAKAMTRQSPMFSNARPQPKRQDAGDYRDRVDREMFGGLVQVDDLFD